MNRHKKMPELPFTAIPALTNLLSLGEQKRHYNSLKTMS
jgi:hypothetical protein